MPTINRRQFLTIAAAGSLGVTGYGAEGRRLQTVRTGALAPNDPPADGRRALRVALLTDLHAPHNWVDEGELAARLRPLKPDIVLVGGDTVDERGNEPLVRVLDGVEAPLGVFAVLGNWEYDARCDLGELRRQYERRGVRLLVNERLVIDAPGRPVELVGLDDWRGGHPDYSLVERAAHPGEPDALRLVLSHCPVAFDRIAAASAEPRIVLSGHTHGGQVAPFGMVLFTPRGSGQYVRGWYSSPDARHRLYVSRGIGYSGHLPLRIGARPEVTLITL